MVRQSLQIGPASDAAGIAAGRSATRRRLLGWAAGGGAALAGLLVPKAGGRGVVRAQAPANIVGSWITFFPQGGGPSDDPNARQLVSFTSDGIVINGTIPSQPVTPDQGPPGTTRIYSTTGHGAWVATAVEQVRLTLVTVDVDDQGNFADLVQIMATLNVAADGNSFDGNFNVQVTDADGNMLFTT